MTEQAGRLSRRALLQWGGALGVSLALNPSRALHAAAMRATGSGTPEDPLDLHVGRQQLAIGGRSAAAVTLNDQLPAP
ncbi:MAG TPA: hypothetical protein PKC22_14220, partial [Rhodocyclaceae bacterium]|nr:hypothetical protein [Rhodocyclaceae bacterium]